ncbi:hypothetical protein MHM84_02435 [Halomonas sp. McH1-25]|uniref:hypothetical protein n=1 Tax=unclassified Halomonas TaxID=2609666 RepID=UPI001EF66A0D|nr:MULTISPECIES: hypothetical protein [unclassified Halomonas]MCG7598635.1 hypothetical protein [Halomonas sp. McH1-25]MCP1343618.1 hypothetical protein [Halomonas sp. FL8]MCP1363305.1 hypothetical protein [Halomonas sp. BBD45]
MLPEPNTITAKCILDDVLTKLKAVENLVNNTLSQLIAQAPSDETRIRNELLQQEFELEITMIRMNLDHLMDRYAQELHDAATGAGNAVLLLDRHEQFAIQSANALYQRARAIQTGE